MQATVLPITYTSAVDDPWWVRFAQPDLTDDTATVAETADLLDALYSIDPCDASEADTVEPDAEDVSAAAIKTYTLAICAQDYDGSMTLPVRLYRSHQEAPYLLRVSGGSVVGEPVITPEEVTAILTVEQQSSIILEYPVVDGFAAAWIGTVTGADSTPVDGPAIHRTGNTLYWQGQVTGTLQVAFVSVFDALEILVNGVDGDMGQATVRCFYRGECTVFVPEMPEPAEDDASLCGDISWKVDPSPSNVTCYQAVTVSKLCSCSKQETESYTYDKIVPCPDYAPTRCQGNATDCMHLLGSVAETEYVACEEDEGYAVADREFYKTQCCEYPSVTLPRCPEEIESYSGGKSIEHGEAFWKSLYGEHTRFVPVSPEDGCGQHITRQQIEPESCCDTIDPLLWDADNSIDTIQDNDTGYLYVKDGLGPFVWRITSDRGYVWFRDSGGGTLTTDENTRFAVLVSGDYPCGTYRIEVTDSCGTVVSGDIESTYGEWEQVYSLEDPHSDGSYHILDIDTSAFAGSLVVGMEPQIGFDWSGNLYKYPNAVFVVVDEDGERVKYHQPAGRELMDSNVNIVCKPVVGSCATDMGSYELTYAIPALSESFNGMGATGKFLRNSDGTCLERIADLPWETMLAADEKGLVIVPPNVVEYSGDYLLSVNQRSIITGFCPSGQECIGGVYIKSYLFKVFKYKWVC